MVHMAHMTWVISHSIWPISYGWFPITSWDKQSLWYLVHVNSTILFSKLCEELLENLKIEFRNHCISRVDLKTQLSLKKKPISWARKNILGQEHNSTQKTYHGQVHWTIVYFQNLNQSPVRLPGTLVAIFSYPWPYFRWIFCNYFKQLELVFLMMEVNGHKWVGFVDLDKYFK